jgi:Right handed beta helix region/Secretion system C-terminal sorting domain
MRSTVSKFILTLGLIASSFIYSTKVVAQQFLTTIDGWNAYVHLPTNYNNEPNTNYPLILFIAGIGEVGTDPSKMLIYGPNHFVEQGNPMSFNINGQTVTPIVISIQPITPWPTPFTLNLKLDEIAARWRIDADRLHVTGLSMGGWSWENYVDGYDPNYTKRIVSMVTMSPPPPDNGITNMRLFAQAGGKLWGIEGNTDISTSLDRIRDTMNLYVPGSARYYLYQGGHCCWNTWYNPSWTDTDGESIYTWMLKQKKSTASGINLPPNANAGADKTITLPTDITTLIGSGNDPDGIIVSQTWTKISGPTTFNINTPNNFQTTISSMTTVGQYQFQLKVVDNNGASATDVVLINVNPQIANVAPTANAGPDKNITLPTNSVTVAGSGADADGTITNYLWTKVAGPAAGTIANPTAANTSINNLTLQGIYEYKLQVTDNGGLTAVDNVIINVAAVPGGGSGCGCDYTLSASGDGGIYFNNGGSINVQPGQKLCITAGTYTYISLNGLVGTETQPITVINCGGKVVSQGSSYGYRITNSRYFKFTGTGAAGIPYGFVAEGTNTFIPSGISIREGTSNYEVDHTECKKVQIGILAKTNPENCNPSSYGLGWVIENISFHNNYIHNTQGEGFYLGHSASTENILDCNGNTITVEPVKLKNVRVYNNILDSLGWDGIQVAAAPNTEIYNNSVKNYGLSNISSQQAGILLGGKSYGSIYDNYINNGTGNGIQVFGYGSVKVFNNIVVDAGYDGTPTRQDAIITDDRPQPNNLYTNLKADIFNNTVVNAGRFCVHLYNSYGTVAPVNKVVNNLLVKPNGTTQFADLYVDYSTSLTPINTNNVRKATIAEAGFVNAAANNYKIVQSSPAVDFGLNISADGVTNDYDGLQRPQGNTYDAGAYEFNFTGAPPNQAPSANAGADKVITLPINTVTLNGTGTDADGTIVSYLWTKVTGPSTGNIINASVASPTINNLAQGVYEYKLLVTDNGGLTAEDLVKITVNAAPGVANIAPSVSAGSAQTITLPTNSVALAASGNDVDGTIVSYLWSKISGPNGSTIVSTNNATTNVTGLLQGTHVFKVLVTDNGGLTASNTVTITVNAATPPVNIPPTANAGGNQTINLPISSLSLNGNGADVDGTIVNYQWTKLSGPPVGVIATPNSASTAVTGLTTAGNYEYKLTVTDNSGLTASDFIIITVNAAPIIQNIAPSVSSGSNQTITLPTNIVSLASSANDVDGTVVDYLWSKISGPSGGTIVTPNASATLVNDLVPGTYIFKILVTDNGGLQASNTVQITVNAAPNIAPNANAGSNQTITLPNTSVTVNGTGADVDGSIVSYEWTKISGPSAVTILNPTNAVSIINGLSAIGIYEFKLLVTDNGGLTDTDTLTITVNNIPPPPPPANQVPTANAGPAQSITLPNNSIALAGSGYDIDGTIISYQWSKISGPASGIIANTTSATTLVNGLGAGVFEFRLEVTDNGGLSAADTVVITVNALPPPINIPPTVSAGTNQNITLPTNTVSLSGSAVDVDGVISNYLWTKVFGPSAGNITNPNSPNTIVNSLVEGFYKFYLTATDNGGLTSKDSVTITVNAQPIIVNIAPSVFAGIDKTITLPTNTTALVASAVDVDGIIVSYEWSKISGPSSFLISTPNSSTTLVTNLVAGVYEFKILVADNGGLQASNTVRVIVLPPLPPPNQAPTANAGVDLTITLPNNSVTLAGTGADVDGTIVQYQWSKVSGPSPYSILKSDTAVTVANGMVQGVYQYKLTVTDNGGLIGVDTLLVTVLPAPPPPNQAPTANAGNDQTITLPNTSINLDGLGYDFDGTITAYKWTKISGPNVGVISNPVASFTTVTGLSLQGVYEFLLTVTDNGGLTATDTIVINVNGIPPPPPPPNVAPTANGGGNKTITLPASSVVAVGSGLDTDGTIASYQWSKLSGPATGSIITPNAASTIIKDLTLPGVYEFSLEVTDNGGLTGTDVIKITVNEIPNIAPVANAGNNQTITLPTNTVNIVGIGTDADGSVTGYQWSKISGPSSAVVVSPNAASTTINNLSEGVYLYQLQVTDNGGSIGRDTVTITVKAAPINKAPTAFAGTNQTIVLPVNKVNLSGTGTDVDGTITSFDWRVLSGPSQYNFVNAKAAQTVLNGLTQGVYKIELTVTDNGGLTAKDTLTVVVEGEVAPLAPTKNSVKATPNPVQQIMRLQIFTKNNLDKIAIVITNIQGLQTFKKEVTTTQYAANVEVNMSAAASGVYFVTVIFGDGEKITKQIVKLPAR